MHKGDKNDSNSNDMRTAESFFDKSITTTKSEVVACMKEYARQVAQDAITRAANAATRYRSLDDESTHDLHDIISDPEHIKIY